TPWRGVPARLGRHTRALALRAWRRLGRRLRARFPSRRRTAEIRQRPLSHRFRPEDAEGARVVLFGDLCGLRDRRIPSGSPSLRALFARADLIIGNCEGPIVADRRDPSAYGDYRTFQAGMSAEFLAATLDALGVARDRCVLSVANNHAADHGGN